MMKRCTKCERHLPRDKFYTRTDSGKPSSWCKECIAKANRARYLADPSRQKQHMRRFRYGITKAQYETMVREQGGLCAICRRESDGRGGFHIDHDHSTGRVRGLLCASCNMGLGQFKDSADILMNALTYLEHGFVDQTV